MKSIIECAVLKFPQQAGWVRPWIEEKSDDRLRLVRYALPESLDVGRANARAWDLMRYDVLIVAVCQSSLAQCRILVSYLHGSQHISKPIFAVGHQTHALALYDLIRMGICDFINLPCCNQELRIRLLNASKSRRPVAGPSARESQGTYLGTRLAAQRQALQENGTVSVNPVLEETQYFHDGDAAQWQRSTFQHAKSVVVDQFEKQYLTEALRRSRGNITLAARNSSKHRRAFWALMQKHNINADDFRDH